MFFKSSFNHCRRLVLKNTYINRLQNFSNNLPVVALVLLVLAPYPCKCQDKAKGQVKEGEDGVKSEIVTDYDYRPRYFYIGDEGITLPCSAKGVPIPQIIWQFNPGQEPEELMLTSENWTTIETNGIVDSTLHFSRVEKRFTGTFRCLATNENGNATLDYDIRILDPDLFWRGKPWIFVIYVLGLVVAGFLFNILLNSRICTGESKSDVDEESQPEEHLHRNSKASFYSLRKDGNNNARGDQYEANKHMDFDDSQSSSNYEGDGDQKYYYTNESMDMDENNNETKGQIKSAIVW